MNAMDKVYKACADATRRKILKLLRERDMTAGEIASRFNVTKPTVSGPFAILREASRLTPEKLARAWRLTLRQFGPFLKQLDTRTERYWKFTSVIVTCEFAKSKLDIKVTFSRTGKISGFWILKTD